jgi:RND family efflux transporter MFP subunit
MDLKNNFLTKSILLEEAGAPVLERLVIIMSFLTLISFIGWAMTMRVSEVATAVGQITPKDEIKQVHHLSGGVISEILVKNGDLVKKGQTLIQLDRSMLDQRIEQAQGRIDLLKERSTILSRQLKITRKLARQKRNSELSLLDKMAQHNMLRTEIADATQKLREIKLELSKTIIKAPAAGFVHGLRTHTVGGVIAPGQLIMEIVPKEQQLVAQVRIHPRDIGHIKSGQQATLKFDTYDYSRYGGMEAELSEISPNTFSDEKNGLYFQGTIILSKTHISSQTGFLPITTGMTLTADIRTGEKTVMEYLLRPVFTSVQAALRER